MLGCRALYHQGWKAVVYQPLLEPFASDDDTWELYRVESDASECHDLAGQEPERLRAMIDLWWREAERYKVLPLDNAPFDRVFGEERPNHGGRNRYVYWPNTGPVTEEAAVNVRNRSHTIRAEVEVAGGGVEGILLAQGSIFGGYAFFVQDSRLQYVHNYVGLEQHRVTSSEPVPTGAHTLTFRFDKTGEHRGTGTLLFDDEPVGAGEIPHFTPTRFSITGEGLCCGHHNGMPVVMDYRPPFRFTGTLHRVVVEVHGEPYTDPEAEADLTLRSQ
jgi:arylsulfatase